MSVFLSVIIPAHNEENRLPNTMEQVFRFLEGQSYTSEVIIVENGSADRTLEVAREFARKHEDIRVIQSEQGKGAAVSVVMLLAAVALFVLELVQYSQRQERLPADVSVAGVRVGGLLPVEVLTRLQQAYSAPIVLYYANNPVVLDPATVGFRANADTMLAAARAAGDVEAGSWSRFINRLIGRETQETVNVPLAADYQRGLLEQFLRDIAARYDRPSGAAQYDVQTLTVNAGAEGYQLDVATALSLVGTCSVAGRRPSARSCWWLSPWRR